jgi:hypothetical protein
MPMAAAFMSFSTSAQWYSLIGHLKHKPLEGLEGRECKKERNK